jgi:hypothetical protein
MVKGNAIKSGTILVVSKEMSTRTQPGPHVQHRFLVGDKITCNGKPVSYGGLNVVRCSWGPDETGDLFYAYVTCFCKLAPQEVS